MKRIVAVLGLLGGLVVTAPVQGSATPSVTQTDALSADHVFASMLQAEINEHVTRVNQERTSRGLNPLTVDLSLQAGAQRWAQSMAAAGQISHDPNRTAGVTIPYETVDESVGYGPSSKYILDALVADPPHLELMIKPGHTLIGVGVAWRNGTQYAVHRYLTPKQAPPPPPPTTAPTTTTTPQVQSTTTTMPPMRVTDPWPEQLSEGAAPSRGGARNSRQLHSFNAQFRMLLQRGGSSTGQITYPGGTTSPGDPIVLPSS
ncbi:MAG: CAP domain-containing protein, partial [Acidimicrobiales bacterium]|nr:CAP domain-containing protein [Acidimicrobiales bacterium]